MATFKEQQAAMGFDVEGIERLKMAALGLAVPARTVTLLNDNGTTQRVSMKEAIKRDSKFMEGIAEEKAYRPCLACGTHACPPGSDHLCFSSTAEPTPNTKGAASRIQIALDAWIAENNYDPYNAYDAEGCTIL